MVNHDWYNKGHGMCYPVCGMVHIKELSERVARMAVMGFLSIYLSGSLPYVQWDIEPSTTCRFSGGAKGGVGEGDVTFTGAAILLANVFLLHQ